VTIRDLGCDERHNWNRFGRGDALWQAVERPPGNVHRVPRTRHGLHDLAPGDRRQKCDQTGGGISITVSGAETRHIGVGEIILEDTTGKCHITNHTATNPATQSPDRQASAIAFN
jgi:hypothetical protein